MKDFCRWRHHTIHTFGFKFATEDMTSFGDDIRREKKVISIDEDN